MRSLPVVSLLSCGFIFAQCSKTHFSEVYDFHNEPVADITAEYFDVAMSVHAKRGVELGIEAAYGEEAINVTVDHALYRTLNQNGQVQSSKVYFAKDGDAILAMLGRESVGRIGKTSREGALMLNNGTFNVRVVGIKNQPTLLLEDPILAVVSQKSFVSADVEEITMAANGSFHLKTADGQRKTISYQNAMIAQPEFEQSGLISPRDCTLVRAGDFIYAKTSQGKESTAVAHISNDNKVKMLSGYRSKLIQVASQTYFWISPR